MCFTIKQKPATAWLQERKQWFLDRVGTVVYRSHTDCKDEICVQEYERGIEIQSIDHADRLYELELFSILDMGEKEVRFFDNLKDRAWFVFDAEDMARNLKCPSCDSGYGVDIGFDYVDGLPCTCVKCSYTWKVLV